MTTCKEFKRGIHNPDFINALNDLRKVHGSFWDQMVNDPELFIGIRDEYLNVYYNGQSVCLLKFDKKSRSIIGFTHNKYLGNDQSGYVESYNEIRNIHGLSNIANLKALVKKKFVHGEKLNSYSKILSSGICLDVEATFVEELVPSPCKRSDYKISSIDFVQLENGVLRFYEAKNFSNQEIKSRNVPRVFEQLDRYKRVLNSCQNSIIASYLKVIDNKKSLGLSCPTSVTLKVDTTPNLIVFSVPTELTSAARRHIQKLRDVLEERLIIE